ncbi:hypothetical protein BJ138DRAFT_1021366 [Hygrophoropsis aurantiaca]|uniref:Uncharacterized protein n=1 Tax=Hygrophoropsis aurantiaca TaxID=72124 RepID=A0ACB7ZQF4_9AGAM|nr:hypothetical protein BJ138DRAFT_1021366 [Hygrophoropsis aurantiaca]
MSTSDAALEIARYSSLCDDFDTAVEDTGHDPIDSTSSTSQTLRNFYEGKKALEPHPPETTQAALNAGSILDNEGKASVELMLRARLKVQSKATVRSERSIRLDPKFALHRTISSSDQNTKMTVQEASHRVRIAQALDITLKPEIKAREVRWKEASKAIKIIIQPKQLPNLSTRNISTLFPLERESYVIMRTTERFYIGQVLDIYKKGAASRYGSIDCCTNASTLAFLSLRVFLLVSPSHCVFSDSESDSEDTIVPQMFSQMYRQHELHTHAQAKHILYHLGKNALVGTDSRALQLTPRSATHWHALTRTKVKKKLPTLKILAGKIVIK